MGFPGGATGKEPASQRSTCKRHGFDPWVGNIPWRRKWQPTLVFLPGESLGWRSLAGYSPRGYKELDTTERLHFTSLLLSSGSSEGKASACNAGDLGSIPGLGRSPGEGKGCPLQCSGLENAMDYTDHGVTKSWTRLSDFHF